MVTVRLTYPYSVALMRIEPAKTGGSIARPSGTGLTRSWGYGPAIITPDKRFRVALKGARGRLRQTNHDLCVGLAVEACAEDSMRHTEAMILTVALLAKRPDTLLTYLLIQERSSISLTYAAAPQREYIRLPIMRRMEA